MNTNNLPIDDPLKSKLNALLEEFESCKLNKPIEAASKKQVNNELITNNTHTQEEKKSSKLNNFLHWFFVSEYKTP